MEKEENRISRFRTSTYPRKVEILRGKVRKSIKVNDRVYKFQFQKYNWDNLYFENFILEMLKKKIINQCIPELFFSKNINGLVISVTQFIDGNVLTESELCSKNNINQIISFLTEITQVKGKYWGTNNIKSVKFSKYIELYTNNLKSIHIKNKTPFLWKQKLFNFIDYFNEICMNYQKFEPVLVHGDLKVGNIIASNDNKLFFIDWGRCRYFIKEYDIAVPIIHGYLNYSKLLLNELNAYNYENLCLGSIYHLLDLITYIIIKAKNYPTYLIDLTEKILQLYKKDNCDKILGVICNATKE